jgi:hypothetical protein
MDWIILCYWSVGVLGVLIGIFVHFTVVVPTLLEHGASWLTIWMDMYSFPQHQPRYKNICLEEGKSLRWWRFLLGLRIFLVAFVIGWFLLIFL